LKAPPRFDRTFATYSYRFPVDSLIHALKYNRRLEMAGAFGEELVALMPYAPPPDVVIPVPLSRRRLLERGFNQAHEIAKQLGHSIRAEACMRVKETPPQALLPWKQRAKNIRDAFACTMDLTGLHVAIVDDVITTGATMNELAKVVKKAGARKVSCWAVARTLKE
jgi:ComF family protein